MHSAQYCVAPVGGLDFFDTQTHRLRDGLITVIPNGITFGDLIVKTNYLGDGLPGGAWGETGLITVIPTGLPYMLLFALDLRKF